MKNFYVRLVSGVTVAALVITAILASRISYGIVVLIAAVGGMYEFHKITAAVRGLNETDSKSGRRTAVIFTVIGLLLSWVFHFRYHFDDIAIILTAIFFFYFIKGFLLRKKNFWFLI